MNYEPNIFGIINKMWINNNFDGLNTQENIDAGVWHIKKP